MAALDIVHSTMLNGTPSRPIPAAQLIIHPRRKYRATAAVSFFLDTDGARLPPTPADVHVFIGQASRVRGIGSPPFRRKLQQRMSNPPAPTLARGPWRRAPPPLAPAAGAGECEGVEPSGRSRPCRRPPCDRLRYCATSRCARSADPTGATSEQRPPILTEGHAVGREDHPPAVGDQTRAPRQGARSDDPLGSAPLQRRHDRGGVPGTAN